MGLDEQFGRDGDSIRRWLAQRASYASEEVRLRVDPEVRGLAEPEFIDDDPAASTPSATDVGAAVVAALRAEAPAPKHAAEPPVERPEPPTVPLHAPPARPVPRQTERQRAQTSEATYAARSTNVVFAPRHASRQTLALLLVGMIAATALAGFVAWREPTQTTLLAAVSLGVLTLVVWGARAATVPTVVLVKNGQLEVRRGAQLDTADLANARTPIAVVGKPSSRRWRVLIERPDAPLLVIDRSIVDPKAFTELVYRVHPNLWSESGAVLEPWQLR